MNDDDDVQVPDPPPPLPQVGAPGEPGETGTHEGVGGDGGDGGRGGRGGIGVKGETGDTGRTGKTGARGARGVPGPEQPILRVIGETGPGGPAGPPGDKQTTFDKWALGVAVTATVVAVIYFSVLTQHRLTDIHHAQIDLARSQHAYGKQVACNQRLVTKTVLAIKARSLFAQQQASEALRLDLAQQAYLATIVLPDTSRQDQLAALATYQQALSFNITATRDNLRVHILNPYPSVADVKACG